MCWWTWVSDSSTAPRIEAERWPARWSWTECAPPSFLHRAALLLGQCLIIEAMSRADLVLYASIYLFVDDATFEAIGPALVMQLAVVNTVRIFTEWMT